MTGHGGSAPGGCLVLGVMLPGWVPASDPPVNRITDSCKKHNLAPTLLRVVTMNLSNLSLESIFLVFIVCIHSALQKLQN